MFIGSIPYAIGAVKRLWWEVVAIGHNRPRSRPSACLVGEPQTGENAGSGSYRNGSGVRKIRIEFAITVALLASIAVAAIKG